MTVEMRNILGAFAGGMLGILVCHYISPFTIPLGVIVGGVLGYWHDAIYHMAKGALRQTVRIGNMVFQFVLGRLPFPQPPRFVRRFFIRMIRFKRSCMETGRAIRACIRAAIRCIRYIATSPLRMWRWLFSDQMHQATALLVLVVLAVAGTNFAAAALVIDYFTGDMVAVTEGYTHKVVGYRPTEWWGDVGVTAIFVAFTATGMLGIMPAMRYHSEGAYKSQSGFYNRPAGYVLWWRYATTTPLRFFVTEYILSFYYAVLTLGMFAFAIAYWLIVACVLAGATLLPVVFAWLFVRGFCYIAIRRAHWLCVSTTMAVTIGIAWWHSFVFTDNLHAWFIALVAGAVSGACVYAVRSLTQFVMDHSRKARTLLASDMEDSIVTLTGSTWKRAAAFFENCMAPCLRYNFGV